MYMAVIPTFIVDIPGDSSTWRVSEDDLMVFLKVLRFNGVTQFSVRLENPNNFNPSNVTALPLQEAS